jgi:diadenosine tetraphosphate (Ap4A) HIT family hydrolase
MHATLVKFGYPQGLLHETEHWCVLLRPQQVTLGSLVLCAKSEAKSLGELGGEAWSDMADVTRRIERALQSLRRFDKINYLALMMVDPHVHFHVVPRYAVAPDFMGTPFADAGWPGVPDLKSVTSLTDPQRQALHAELLDAFRQAG